MLISTLPRKERRKVETIDDSAFANLTTAELVKLAALLSHPWHGYCSTKVTTAFHQSQSPNRYIIAASQSGKTMAAAREAWMYACDNHPFREVPRVAKYGIIAVGSLEGTAYTGVLKALWNTRPHSEIDWDKTKWAGEGSRPTRDTIVMNNGTEIRIVSSRGGSTGAASVQADWIWIDEPPKRDRFSELLARVTRTDGHIWLSFTAYDTEQDLSWLKLYLEGDVDKGILPESPGWERFNMELNVENCPWMTQDQIDRIWAQTPRWIADQRLKGLWDTPPANAIFSLNANIHDLNVPFETAGFEVGPWAGVVSADHGELAGREHVLLILLRKCRNRSNGKMHAQIAIVGEYVSKGRTTIREDAEGIKAQMVRVQHHISDYGIDTTLDLSDPQSWHRYVGDVNSAGKGMAGFTVNEALALELGLRKDSILKPDKSAGSVDDGLIKLSHAFDESPCQFRIASGSTGQLSASELWRSITRHRGKEDETKHAIDALRYGIVPFLDVGSAEFRALPDVKRDSPFATIRRRD